MEKQLDIRDNCDTIDVLYPKENGQLDNYYRNVLNNIECYLSNPDNKKTPTIKREYFDIKDKIVRLNKTGEISDDCYKYLSIKIKSLDTVLI